MQQSHEKRKRKGKIYSAGKEKYEVRPVKVVCQGRAGNKDMTLGGEQQNILK